MVYRKHPRGVAIVFAPPHGQAVRAICFTWAEISVFCRTGY